MATEFSRFEKTISERRVYRDNWGLALEIKSDAQLAPLFSILDAGALWTVAGSHVMNPGFPDPAALFSGQFGFAPPVDFVDFYKRWDGGFLLFGVPYRLLSMKNVVETNLHFRNIRKRPPQAPWSIIRFADIGHSDFIGYRRKGDGWVVSLILNEYHDDELLSGQFEAPVLAQSFAGWIDRLIDKDGALPDGVPAVMPRVMP